MGRTTNGNSVRVASLLPSATELICGVGAADALVGISHECDYPETIRDRPVLTRSRIALDGSSAEIDERFRASIPSALSVYVVDADLLGRLRPNVIVTQALCEVCAVSLDDVRAAVSRWVDNPAIEIVSLTPTRLDDLFADVERVAVAVGRPRSGSDLSEALRARMEATTRRARSARSRPRVATIEWMDPVMLGGTWMSELIERAGGTPVGVEAGRPAPTVTLATLAELAPEVVLIKPCGFSLARAFQEPETLSAIARALPESRIFVADGNAYFNRPGPRLIDSLEILAACTHPDLFGDLASTHRDAFVPFR